jgi:hypothetical protein
MNRTISTRNHVIMGFIVSVILFFAPNIFGFNDNGGAAAWVPRIVAIVLFLSELVTDNGMSLIGLIPMRLHLMMDGVAGIFLAVSPWLFGFYKQGANAWLPPLIIGLIYTGTALMTRTAPDRRASTSRRVHA